MRKLVLPKSKEQVPLTADQNLPPLHGLEQGQLESGLSYFVGVDSAIGVPGCDTIHLRLVVRAGSVMETDDERGAAHFVEHMGFKSTENFEDHGQLVSQSLDSLGVVMCCVVLRFFFVFCVVLCVLCCVVLCVLCCVGKASSMQLPDPLVLCCVVMWWQCQSDCSIQSPDILGCAVLCCVANASSIVPCRTGRAMILAGLDACCSCVQFRV
jgi:hypothetical protein